MAKVKRKACHRRRKGKQFLCGYWVKNIMGGEDYSLLPYLTQDGPLYFEDHQEFVRQASVWGKQNSLLSADRCGVLWYSGAWSVV